MRVRNYITSLPGRLALGAGGAIALAALLAPGHLGIVAGLALAWAAVVAIGVALAKPDDSANGDAPA